MTAIDPSDLQDDAREASRQRLFTRINTADKWFQVLGLAWLTPVLRAVAGDNPRAQGKEVWRLLGVPLLAIAMFLAAWAALAPTVQTSLGAIPRPAQVWEQVGNLNSGGHQVLCHPTRGAQLQAQPITQPQAIRGAVDKEAWHGG